MDMRALQFLALVAMGLALIPSGAHLAAMPNKIGMDRDAYFTVQQIYAGWWVLGFTWVAAFILNLWLTISLRADRPAFYFAFAAFLSVVIMFAIFYVWTLQANQATANWTEMPENWEILRRNWEYSHAVNALVAFVGFCSLVLSVLTARPGGPASPTLASG